MQGSALDDYMAQYGDRLQSLLDGSAIRMNPAAVGAPGSATPPGQPPAGARAFAAPDGPQAQPARPAQPGAAPPGAAGAAGQSFRDKWKESSPEEQKKSTDDLEQSLKQGNQTIDSAYDDLVKQLGQRPGNDSDLTREEKGMFLMEFGLSLMANSSGKAYGDDLGGAIGASGLEAVQGQRKRRQGERDSYDRDRLAIESNRAGAKSRLAEQSALESRAESRDQRRTDRENSQLAGVVTGADDMAYGYTRGGGISKLEQPSGQGVKVKPKPIGAGGAGGRGFESDRRFNMYMDIYGKDGGGKPLEGQALEEVRKRALAFSADPKAATLSDAEARTMAERSADAFQKSNWAQFRDMKPDEIKKWRDKAAEENYQRLKKGEEISLQPPTNAPPVSKLDAGQKKTPKPYTSVDAVKADIRAKKLRSGDVVIVGNKRFQVP